MYINDEISHLRNYLITDDLCDTDINKYVKIYQETGCPKIYERIINGYMNTLINLTFKLRKCYGFLSEKEMLSCVFQGMEKTIKKYDETKGASLKTYSIYWIRHFIDMACLTNKSNIKISLTTYHQVKKLSWLLNNTDKDCLTNVEISNTLNLSIKKIVELKSILECMSNYSISEGGFINNQMEMTLFENKTLSYDAHLINDCIDKLDKRSAMIVRERFGLNDENPKTLREIGVIFSLSDKRIHQILDQIYPKLKKIYLSKKID